MAQKRQYKSFAATGPQVKWVLGSKFAFMLHLISRRSWKPAKHVREVLRGRNP